MALAGNFSLKGQYQAMLPSGTDAAVVAPAPVADWIVQFPAAYIRVERVDGSNTSASATVSIYTDATKAAIARQLPVTFTPDMNGPNFIKQAYEYMKRLPDYMGLVDVLEDGQTS